MKNPDAHKLIAFYEHYGQEIPAGLIPPELQDIEQQYWGAFWDMSGDRQAGGPIPWMALRRYWEVSGFDDFSTFQRIIKSMDNAYLEARAERDKTPKK